MAQISQTPKNILEWLEQNKHCAHHDLHNSLFDAGHPPKSCIDWVKNFFGNQYSAVPELVREGLQKQLGQVNGGGAASGQSTKAAVAGDSKKNAPPFLPDGAFGDYFPNALLSRDLGFHPIAMNCSSPRAMHVLNVLTHDECDQLIAGCRSRMTRSTVVSNSQESGFSSLDDSRTSYGSHYDRGSTELILRIEKRLSEIFRFPMIHGESIQILNYGQGGEYKPHFDYFDLNTEGGKAAANKGGNRVATIIMYLNNVDLGGATIFPEANLQVMPIKGSAVYFDYKLPDGALDTLSLHGGTPVIRGEKWIATKWVRELPWG